MLFDYKIINHDILQDNKTRPVIEKKKTTNINGYMLIEQTDPDSCMLFELQINRQKEHRLSSQ